MSGRIAAWLLAPALLVLVVLLAGPIAYLLSFSVLEATDGPEPGGGGFTLMNYAKLASDPFYLRIVGKTLWVSALSTAIAATIGYVLAHFMWRTPRRWRGLLTVLVMSPLLVSIVVSSYGWVVILGSQGVVNQTLIQAGVITQPLKLMFTDGAIVVGLVHVAIPFMALSILAVLGGSGPNFITTLIYNQFVTLFDWPFGAALAALLLALCLGIVLLSVWGVARLSAATIGRA
jgi:putative spermidine/putrescine transport system permease protein